MEGKGANRSQAPVQRCKSGKRAVKKGGEPPIGTFARCGSCRSLRPRSQHLPGDLKVFRGINRHGMVLGNDGLECETVRQET